VANLTAAVTAHKAAVDKQQLAYGILQNEKLAWNEAYRRSHRELQLRFLENPKRVERFFWPVRKGRRGESETVGDREGAVGTALVAVATEPAGAGAVKTAVAGAGAGAQVGATAGVKPNAELATTVSNALAPAAASATA
jgi:hypothetical protein